MLTNEEKAIKQEIRAKKAVIRDYIKQFAQEQRENKVITSNQTKHSMGEIADAQRSRQYNRNRITALHTILNELRSKPNSHATKERNYEIERYINEFKKELTEVK